jgi:flagellum-specific peptidoglycan hydrolase FlgJ
MGAVALKVGVLSLLSLVAGTTALSATPTDAAARALTVPTGGSRVSAESATAATARLPTRQARFLRRMIDPARRSHRRDGVPASVTIAQAILETGWGASALARSANNFFGMTCTDGDPGPIATGCRLSPDRYCDAGGCHQYLANFRVYRSLSESVRDHGRNLMTNPRYAQAKAQRRHPDRFVVELERAGYATNPQYAELLTKIMVKYDLYRYDAR